MLTELDVETIDLIKQEYHKDSLPWTIGFSGGKDSSAVLKLTYIALKDLKVRIKPIKVVYCDTGVEIPTISSFVKLTLNDLEIECRNQNIPLQINIVEPKLENRYFSKVIGRGYVPPTNKFRWCTDKLRVYPIQTVLDPKSLNIILLGVRNGESVERDRILSRHKTSDYYYLKQTNFAKTKLFAPIIDYKVENIWSLLKNCFPPISLNGRQLEALYNSVNLDNIDILDSFEKSLQKGRFGCWTCTVIRKDKAMKNLISNGYTELQPLLDFRDWLISIRDNPIYRYNKRRNGASGLGPFTIDARKEILDNLLKTQTASGIKLIHDVELDYIKKAWKQDHESEL